MSGTSGPQGLNQLQEPLGRGMPMPGGNVVQMPAQRGAMPGGAPGGAGVPAPRATTQSRMNEMAMTQPPGDPLAGGPASLTGQSLQDTLTQHMKRAKAAFDVTGKALKQLDLMRKSLERLSDKQDMVQLDDIIEEAGKLVSHGIDPVALAGILADAPQEGGGEALGGWVAGHAQSAMQAEQNLIQQHNQNAHEMGVAALHSMMAAVSGHGLPDPSQLQQNGNSLQPPNHPGGNESPDLSQGTMAYGARFLKQGGQ